jgi:hypothetical protein
MIFSMPIEAMCSLGTLAERSALPSFVHSEVLRQRGSDDGRRGSLDSRDFLVQNDFQGCGNIGCQV